MPANRSPSVQASRSERSIGASSEISVADICFAVGLRSVGSFTTSFGRAFGLSPAAYRAAYPSAVARVATAAVEAADGLGLHLYWSSVAPLSLSSRSFSAWTMPSSVAR